MQAKNRVVRVDQENDAEIVRVIVKKFHNQFSKAQQTSNVRLVIASKARNSFQSSMRPNRSLENSAKQSKPKRWLMKQMTVATHLWPDKSKTIARNALATAPKALARARHLVRPRAEKFPI